MRILAVVSTLIVFELALMLISPAIDENQSAQDFPKYINDSKNVVAVEFNEENISDDQILPETSTNMSPAYIVATFATTGQLTNYCSGSFEKAAESLKNQRYDEAISYLNDCLDYADAWYDKGYIEFQQNRCNEALYDFSKAIEIDPTNADYWTFKGIVLLKQKNYEEALSAFNTSINLNPNLSNTRKWKARALNRWNETWNGE
jgi:tetratricopeptide (TPR) repeat protein